MEVNNMNVSVSKVSGDPLHNGLIKGRSFDFTLEMGGGVRRIYFKEYIKHCKGGGVMFFLKKIILIQFNLGGGGIMVK